MERIGIVTVIAKGSSSNSLATCVCDCGVEFKRAWKELIRSVKRGQVASCGCLKKKPFKDITNKTFYRLRAVRRLDFKMYGKTAWECVCICGNTVNVDIGSLQAGLVKSCGCLIAESGIKKRVDITGRTFGRLTAKTRVGKSEHGQQLWECECVCGEVVVVSRPSLTSNATTSCGCARQENGTIKLEEQKQKYRVANGFNPTQLMTPVQQLERTRFAVVAALTKKRDDYTCQWGGCGKRGGKLHSHHNKSWAEHPELRFDPFNIITLCDDCHINKVHEGNLRKPVSPEIVAILDQKLTRIKEDYNGWRLGQG